MKAMKTQLNKQKFLDEQEHERDVVISVEKLEKIFPNKVHAVKGVDLKLYKGEVLGLLGPNGAGKTTTMKIILGLLQKTEGSISILDTELSNPSIIKKIKSQIGYAPQELVFYPFLTVEENAHVFATCYNVRNLSERIDELFKLFQLDEIRKRKADILSGGQKRRLNLVLALLHTPKILILDEPSVGMDPQGRNVLWECIEKLANEENISIILSTHLMEVADKLSDRIAIIDNGKVIAVGTPEELKENYNGTEYINLKFTEKITLQKLEFLKEKITEILKPKYIKIIDSKIIFTVDNWTAELPGVLDLVKTTNTSSYLTDFKIRGSTLEDVFIKLTGRKLRED